MDNVKKKTNNVFLYVLWYFGGCNYTTLNNLDLAEQVLLS